MQSGLPENSLLCKFVYRTTFQFTFEKFIAKRTVLVCDLNRSLTISESLWVVDGGERIGSCSSLHRER